MKYKVKLNEAKPGSDEFKNCAIFEFEGTVNNSVVLMAIDLGNRNLGDYFQHEKEKQIVTLYGLCVESCFFRRI